MTFEEAMTFVLHHEGGYVNNPHDPGGETNYGISKRQYPDLDIQAITPSQALDIYRRDYWQVCRCEELPELIRLPLFDTAVNMGSSAAISMLQRACGANPDGVMGPATITQVLKFSDIEQLRSSLLTERMTNYTINKEWARFGAGWAMRVLEVALW